MKLKRNIRFLISFHLGLFFTPLVVMAFHHHSFAKCTHEHSQVVLSENTGKPCPICEYEFSVNDLPKTPNNKFFGFLYTNLIVIVTQTGYISATENLISPRAPPAIA